MRTVVVESDKADMDVESFSEGILAVVVVAEGERAVVGAPIAFVAESEADVAEAQKKAAGAGGGGDFFGGVEGGAGLSVQGRMR
jgi:pyruvate dehydrogenase E2 component (dihydrolipoamide acetyltransferase)